MSPRLTDLPSAAIVLDVWAHTRKDGWLVVIALLHLGVVLFTHAAWEHLPLPALVALGAVTVFLTCTNYQCVAHYFIHNPFFSRRAANDIFAIVNSVLIGVPQTLYRFHHLNHHKFNNDARDPKTKTTRDLSSIYRFSARGDEAVPESILTYALFGPFRADIGHFFRVARDAKLARQVWAETGAIALFVTLLAWSRPRFLLFYVPVYLAGQWAAYAENWLEHFGATPGDRKTDSVSSYGRLYNFVWFNNGYHQEHHYRASTHWTELPKLRAEMLPENERHVVRGAHWFNVRAPLRVRA